MSFGIAVVAILVLWVWLVDARVHLPWPHLLLAALALVVLYECYGEAYRRGRDDGDDRDDRDD